MQSLSFASLDGKPTPQVSRPNISSNLCFLQVVDFLPVNANTFERAIRQYGSVMTCMKWGGAGETCDMTGYTG